MSDCEDIDSLDCLEEIDRETIAAIERGIRDADAGRTVPFEEVRRMVSEWITEHIDKVRGGGVSDSQ